MPDAAESWPGCWPVQLVAALAQKMPALHALHTVETRTHFRCSAVAVWTAESAVELQLLAVAVDSGTDGASSAAEEPGAGAAPFAVVWRQAVVAQAAAEAEDIAAAANARYVRHGRQPGRDGCIDLPDVGWRHEAASMPTGPLDWPASMSSFCCATGAVQKE